MGGVSAAGFRPGLGRGGITHSLLVKIEGVWRDPGMGARRGLLIVEGAAGTRACGERADMGEEEFDADMIARQAFLATEFKSSSAQNDQMVIKCRVGNQST